ncbi:hypothetical protein [Vibrio metschnikovii]|uniref:hypothetical protein n=1 Tax=Vibrio metschnikovii TaxID=28172 RepID=UPI00164A961B|nr:hypothetical protein [Vibrio metschnikovii]MBC5830886.1 hypothetical protein [Vibrio metschnikovii]
MKPHISVVGLIMISFFAFYPSLSWSKNKILTGSFVESIDKKEFYYSVKLSDLSLDNNDRDVYIEILNISNVKHGSGRETRKLHAYLCYHGKECEIIKDIGKKILIKKGGWVNYTIKLSTSAQSLKSGLYNANFNLKVYYDD